jgi:2'-5' RNA ligase
MGLAEYYEHLCSQALKEFEANRFQLDHLVDSSSDTRYGITLLARPSDQVKQAISEALEEIKSTAPEQYYYPESDIHITVLSIISCYPDFSLSDINLSKYSQLISEVLRQAMPFSIIFEGLTASPECIMIRGFPESNTLNSIRSQLRKDFKKSTLQHSIDKRYRIRTVHSTVLRFKQEISALSAFVEKIKALKTRKFGTCTIDELEFVANDWYLRKQSVKLLDKFKLT